MELLKITEPYGFDERALMDVYAQSNRENLRSFYPGEPETEETLRKLEHDYLSYLKADFLADSANSLYVLAEGKRYLSALRLTEVKPRFFFLEALETAPEQRGRGYASALLRAVAAALSKNGPFTIADCVYKKNTASIKTHESVGFVKVSDAGYDYLCGEASEKDFGFVFEWKGV